MTLFLIDSTLKATAILGAAALTTLLLRRASAATRHLVWTAALLAVLVLPVLSLALPRWQVPVVTLSSTAIAPTLGGDAASTAMAARMIEKLRGFRGQSEAAAVADPATTGPRARLSMLEIGAILWFAGAAFVLARLLLGLTAVRILSSRTDLADDAPWLPLARRLANDLGISRITFRRSGRTAMPIAWGLWRPTVMMPATADAWPEDRLRIVLLHELAHVKRRDCLTHVLAQAACALHWFNPLAWIAARRVRAERERACDDLVLTAGTPGPDYADQLLAIARVMRAGRFSSVMATASLAMAHRSQLEGRLMAILDPSVPRTGISRSRLFAASCIALVALVPLASVQAWTIHQEVTPAPAAPVVAAPFPNPAPAPAPAPAPQVAPVAGVRGGVQGGVHGGVQGGAQRGMLGGVNSQRVEGVVEQDSKGKADPKVVAALTAALKDTDKDVRETAMHALIQLRDPGIFEPLLVALKDASADVRQQAAFGLSQMRDKRAVDPLVAATRDSSDDVREQVAFALGQLRDPKATEALISLLKDTHANVREQAAFALGQIRDPRAIDALTAALKDASADVRQQAAFALGQIAR